MSVGTTGRKGGEGEKRGQRPGVSASCPMASGATVLTRVGRAWIQLYHLNDLFISVEA